MSARARVGGLTRFGRTAPGREGMPLARFGQEGAALGHEDGRDRAALDGHSRSGQVRESPTGTPTGELEVSVLLDVLAAACGAGVSLPRALCATGSAAGGQRGAALERAGTALVLGASWAEAWTGAPAPLGPVVRALRPAWEEGGGPVDALRGAAKSLRRDHHARALDAAGRLGVRLVLPLGLCYLPAFVLVGLVPVLMSMAGRALAG